MEDGIIRLFTRKEVPITAYVAGGNKCELFGCSGFVEEGKYAKRSVMIWVMLWICNGISARMTFQEDRKHAWAEVVARDIKSTLELCPRTLKHTKDQSFHDLLYHRDLRPRFQ